MSHFVFTLDSVLQLRLRAEQQCQRDFAAAQARLAGIETQLHNLAAQMTRAAEDLRACLRSGPLDPLQLATHARYNQSLTDETNRLNTFLKEARLTMDRAKASLQAAASQRKSLEKLRERQLDQFRLDQHKHEQITHDDLTTRIPLVPSPGTPACDERSRIGEG